jgi:hypothetical protein
MAADSPSRRAGRQLLAANAKNGPLMNADKNADFAAPNAYQWNQRPISVISVPFFNCPLPQLPLSCHHHP